MKRHGTHRDSTDDAFDELLRISFFEYTEKQRAFSERTAKFSRWTIDTDALTLKFYNDQGDELAVSIVPVATYLPNAKSWAWAWANDAFSDRAREEASRLKGLADRTGYKIFFSTSFPVERDEVDELCALSLNQLGAMAIFKIKDEEPWLLVAVE